MEVRLIERMGGIVGLAGWWIGERGWRKGWVVPVCSGVRCVVVARLGLEGFRRGDVGSGIKARA